MTFFTHSIYCFYNSTFFRFNVQKFILFTGTGTDVQVKCCFYSLASAPAIIHYLPPIVTSVRHLPYSTSGIDNLDITTRAGGLPTGGAAYNGFVPSQLDAGKYSKRRRSNVAVIIIRMVFISSFLFYCLLSNHSFQSNPKQDD